MEVQFKSKENNIVTLTVTATDAEYFKVYNRELKKAASDPSLKIPGFRPGKIPTALVEQYRGQAIQTATYNHFRDNGVAEFAGTVDYSIVSVIEALVSINEKDKESFFSLELKLEVIEPFDVEDLSFIKVKLPEIDTKEAVEEMVLALRQQRSTREECTKGAEMDDLVEFTSTATDENGLEFSPLTTNGDTRAFVIGDYQTPEAFSVAFLGKKVGDEFTFTYTPKVAEGAEAVSYEINAKVVGVQRRILPEVDEAFVSEFLGRKGDIDDLRRDIERNIVREIKLNTQRYIEPQILSQLVEHFIEKELPEKLLENTAKVVEEEARKKVAEDIKRLPELPADLSVDSILADQDFNHMARVRLIQEYALKALASKVTISREEVIEFVRELSIMFETPEQYVNSVLKDQKLFQKQANQVLHTKIFNYVLEKATVTKSPMTYTNLVRTLQQ